MSSSSGVSSSSSSSSSSLPPSIQAADPVRIALDDCITRIEQVIQKVKLGIPSENVDLKKFTCPINWNVPEDPVVTNCGHLYERVAIERVKGEDKPCPLCNTQITILCPNYALKERIQNWQKEDPIPTFSNFEGADKESAVIHLNAAKKFEEKLKYKEAIKCYSEALRYIKSLKVYAAILPLYEKLGEKEKATLGRLYLSLYQIQAGNIPEAIETLKQCKSDTLKLDPLVLGLTLQSRQSHEKIEEDLKLASTQTNTEDKIFIYKQIIAYAPVVLKRKRSEETSEYAPHQLEAYKQLIPLITGTTEKRSLLLQAADLAHKAEQLDLEKSYRSEAEHPLVSTIISKADWANAKTINLPPYPQALVDFLDGDCTIWSGKKRSQTHIVVPLFPMVDIDGTPKPSTLDYLDKLDKSSGGPGYRFIWDKIPKDIPAEKEFHWAVLTNDVLPESRSASYENQLKLLPPGYEMPGVFDAARAILWENRHSGKRCFSDNPCTFTRCKAINDHSLFAGGFDPAVGLAVSIDYYDNERLGIAGWRKF